MTRTDRAARLAARLLLAAGLLALAYATYVVVEATRFQAIEQQRIDLAPHDDTAADTSAAIEGHAIGAIRLPRIGISAVVAQGDSPLTLRHAVGHLADTALPGDTGNVVLAGHRDTFFRALKDVRAGDAIVLTTRRGEFTYTVESTAVIEPTDVRELQPTGGRTLTLVTCFPFFYVGPSPDRFIVRARQIEAAR